MFKLSQNYICSCIITAFIFCFANTVDSNANVMRAQFQEEMVIIPPEKNAVARERDIVVLQNIGKQDGLALGAVKKVSFFKEYAGFWGGISIVSLLTALFTGDLANVIVALISLFI
ncbi:hypothetical protein [Bartonella sp. CB169]|uniref:hypothetical protein n=1 Tax=Bartonella sp. CB169 TaxID=3112257 RepID=UPI00300DC038